MTRVRSVLLVSTLVVMLASVVNAQQAMRRDLWNDVYGSVDDQHKQMQRQALTPWLETSSRIPDELDKVRIAAAQSLRGKIRDYESHPAGEPGRALAIGMLLSDLGMALDTRSTSSDMIEASERAVRTLAPLVGQNPQTDLIYAQAVHRLARSHDRPRTDRRLVANALLEGLQLLRTNRSKEAEVALAEAWRPFFKRTADLPGIARVQVFAFGRTMPENPCGSTQDLQQQVKALVAGGRAAEARELGADIAARFVEAVRRGCKTTAPEIFARNANTGRRVHEVLFEGTPNSIKSDVAEAELRNEIKNVRGQWPRVTESNAPVYMGHVAANGTVEQFRDVLMLIPPRMTNSGDARELAGRAINVGSSLAHFGEFSLAEAVYERVRELRPGDKAGGWADTRDVVAVAKFHIENGKRARATQLARAAVAGFPATDFSPADALTIKIVLSQNAIDEGDAARGWILARELVQAATTLKVPSEAARVFKYVSTLPANSDELLREPAIEMARELLKVFGREKPRFANTRPMRTQVAQIALQVAGRYQAVELVASVREIEGSYFDSMEYLDENGLWITTDDEAWQKVATGSLSTPFTRALKARDYAQLGRIGQTIKVPDPQYSCDHGFAAVIKIVARRRAVGVAPSRDEIDRAVVRTDRMGTCVGNGYFEPRRQLDGQISVGKFWLDHGEPVVAAAFFEYALPSRYGQSQYGELEAPTVARMPDMAEKFSWWARARMGSGDYEGAVKLGNEITRGLVQRMASVGSEADRIREATRFRETFDVHVAAAAGHSARGASPNVMESIAAAFEADQLARVTRTGNASARLSARLGAADAELAGLLRRRQDLADIIEREGRVVEDGADGPAKQAASQSLSEATRDYASISRTLATRYPALAKQETESPAKLADVQAALRKDEALFVSHSAGEDIYAFLITRSAVQLRRLGKSRAAIAQSVDDLRRSLVIQPRMPRFDEETAEVLGNEIVGVFAEELKNVKHLLLVLDGPLESLPFALLMPAKPGLGRTYLFESISLSTLPTVRSMFSPLPDRSPQSIGGTFLGIGNPVLEGTGQKGVADLAALRLRSPEQRVQSIRQMAPLPESADELRKFSQAVRGKSEDLWLAADASERRIKSADLSKYRLIVFATHAVVAGEVGSIVEPGLILTPPNQPDEIDDGVLTASEVAALNLAADLVVLSGCNTASSDGRSGADGLSGLTRAFLNAGARNLVVSHWRVGSVATAALMNRFAEELATGKPTSVALRGAMLAQLKAAKTQIEAHPAFWSPFFVVGRD